MAKNLIGYLDASYVSGLTVAVLETSIINSLVTEHEQLRDKTIYIHVTGI